MAMRCVEARLCEGCVLPGCAGASDSGSVVLRLCRPWVTGLVSGCRCPSPSVVRVHTLCSDKSEVWKSSKHVQ
jgi:hypothetical protein